MFIYQTLTQWCCLCFSEYISVYHGIPVLPGKCKMLHVIVEPLRTASYNKIHFKSVFAERKGKRIVNLGRTAFAQLLIGLNFER